MAPTTILIAHSRELFAGALSQALSRQKGFSVSHLSLGRPTTGLDVIAAVEKSPPEVLILDYWMEGLLAPAVTKAVRSSAPGCKVVIVCWLAGTSQVLSSLRSGASAFLPESITMEELVGALRRVVSADEATIQDDAGRVLASLASKDEETKVLWERMKTLTRRELQILALISLGQSLPQIGRSLSIKPRTARNYIDSMLAKAGAHSQLELLAMARDCGLIAG